MRRLSAATGGIDSINIRPFEERDESALVALWRDCELVVAWNDPAKDIARKLQVDRDLFLVGESEQGLVASVMGGYDGHRGWINYLAVHPSVRGQGLGRQIMVAVEKAIAARGCPKINLQVRSTNEGVVAFYRALGYAVDETVSLGKRLVED